MKNNIENFNKIELKDNDWFDRTEFTLAQLDVIKGNYLALSDNTFTNENFKAIEYRKGRIYNADISYCKLEQQLHPCDFFPESTSVPLSEGNPTSEAQTYVTEAPVDSEGTIPMYNLQGNHTGDFSMKKISNCAKKIADQHMESSPYIVDLGGPVQLNFDPLPVEVLQLSHLKAFILSHNASLYLKPEEGKLVYMVYMEDEGEYKIETKGDLDKLSDALDVLKEMQV